jgi:hypothetical protein
LLPFDFSFSQLSGHVRRDDPMAFFRGELAHDHHDDVLPYPQISIPTGKQLGATEADAPANFIGMGQRFRYPVSVLRQEIRMALGNVTFPLLSQLDYTPQVGTREMGGVAISDGEAE